MGHLRGVLRACIWDAEDADPGAVLGAGGPAGAGAAGRLAGDDGLRPRRTGRRRPATPGGCTWPTPATRRCCCAHPTAPSGSLDGVTGLLVGVDATTHRETLDLEVPGGTTLIAYTDGLIERPGQDMDQGIARAVRAARRRAGRRRPRASSATPRSPAPSTTGTTSR